MMSTGDPINICPTCGARYIGYYHVCPTPQRGYVGPILHCDVGDPRKVESFYLMAALGEKGHHVMVRFDPLRPDHNFTVVIDSQRIGDTDSPHTHHCHIVETGNDSYRFRNSTTQSGKGGKTKKLSTT